MSECVSDKVHPAEPVGFLPETQVSIRDVAFAEQLEQALDAVDVGLIIYDAKNRLLLANRKMSDIYPSLTGKLLPGTPRRALAALVRQDRDVLPKTAETDLPDGVSDTPTRPGEHSSGFEECLRDGRWILVKDRRLDNGLTIGTRTEITEIKKREQALLESQKDNNLYRAIMDNVQVAIYAKSEDLRIKYVNKAWSRLSQVSPGDAIGKTDLEIFGNNGATFREADQQVLDSDKPLAMDEVLERDDGRVFNLFARKSALTTRDGARYLIGSTTDMTATRALQDDLRATINAMHMGVVLVDRELHVHFINDAFHEIWNTKATDFQTGCPFRTLMDVNRHNGIYDIADADWEDYVASRCSEIAKGEVEPREFKRRDGAFLIYFVRELSDGKRLICYFDITEQKHREHEIKVAMERNQLSEEVLSQVDQSVLIKDQDLKIIYANESFAKVLGKERVDCAGLRARDFFPEEEAAEFERSEREALETGQSLEYEEDHETNGKKGARIVHKTRITTGEGLHYIAVTLTDISDIREREAALAEAEQKAQLSDRAKSEFLANMSHEIRTPMNGVLGMAELLMRTELDSKQSMFADIIVKSGNALLTIINDILDFSKIDAGQLVLDPAPFDLREAIEDVATLISTRAKEKDIELIARVAPELPDQFMGDVGRLRQIITNLMGNAVKFTEKGHVLVDVTASMNDGEWLLTCKVTDTGIGIPEGKVDAVFDKFSQVDASATRRHEGTGLGLAISSRLVALMDGEIGATSVLGEGSTFWFTIRLGAVEGAVERSRPVPVDVTAARIVVVDDNAVNREILMEQMRSWNFDACAVESGELALELLAEAARRGTPAELAVIDFQMPGMTGDEVVRAIRANPALCDMATILLTSVDQALSPSELRALAVGSHLLKPARSSRLLDAIVTGLQTRRMAKTPDAAEKTEGLQRLKGAGPTDSTLPADGHTDTAKALPQEASVQGKADVASTARPRILVAEDNEINQLVFTRILDDLDVDYRIVGDGQLAIDACRDELPDLVLMDVSMPVKDGFDATVELRGMGFANLPIIGVTAHALKGDRERSEAAGMSDYLTKPVSPDKLSAKLEEWLGGARESAQA
jgi:PAS domain S-box-containing protein